jgi:hypothetical protein
MVWFTGLLKFAFVGERKLLDEKDHKLYMEWLENIVVPSGNFLTACTNGFKNEMWAPAALPWLRLVLGNSLCFPLTNPSYSHPSPHASLSLSTAHEILGSSCLTRRRARPPPSLIPHAQPPHHRPRLAQQESLPRAFATPSYVAGIHVEDESSAPKHASVPTMAAVAKDLPGHGE